MADRKKRSSSSSSSGSDRRPLDGDLATLLARVAQGDKAALRAIYVRQSSRLFGVAMAVLRDRVAAADALQEGVVRVWREAGRFDPKLDDADTWIAAAVRRAAVTIARARGREGPPEDEGVGDGAIDPLALDHLNATIPGQRVRGMLERMEARERHGIILGFVNGLSYPELAARLDMPIGAVRAWLQRALQSMRRELT